MSPASSVASSPCTDPAPTYPWEGCFNLLATIQRQPVRTLWAYLDELVKKNKQVDLLRGVLGNPFNLSDILKMEDRDHPEKKLIICIMWMSRAHACIVKDMVEMYRTYLNILPEIPGDEHDHPLGFNFTCKLGSILADCGWFEEAIFLLKTAARQANRRPHQLLRALRPLLLLETFFCHLLGGSRTLPRIYNVLDQYRPHAEVYVATHTAIATHYYELGWFLDSYNACFKAFTRMTEETCRMETIVAVLRQLAKSCLAVGIRNRAWKIIMQAVLYAHAQPEMYAESLEDMAHFLLIRGAYREAIEVHQEAMTIHYGECGMQHLHPKVENRNLVFKLFLQAQKIRYGNFFLTFSEDQFHLAKQKLATMETVIDLQGSDHLTFDVDVKQILGFERTLLLPLTAFKESLALEAIACINLRNQQ